MRGIYNFLNKNYWNRNGNWKTNNNRIYNMAAVLTPEGIVTQQSPGESLDGLDEKVAHLHPVYRSDIKGKFRLSAEIDSIYRDFIGSKEGKEFIKYLQKEGNGTSRPGSIDDILVVNKGSGMVAATMPDLVRKNLIINQDYIEEYVNMASSRTGLTQRQVVENILVHELHHVYGQTRSDRRGDEHKVEYNNDISLIRFYTELAKKDMENSDTYLAKARLFTIRYGGKYRKTMDEMISKTTQHIEKSYLASQESTYRQAA